MSPWKRKDAAFAGDDYRKKGYKGTGRLGCVPIYYTVICYQKMPPHAVPTNVAQMSVMAFGISWSVCES